jgi:hypothetical protein
MTENLEKVKAPDRAKLGASAVPTLVFQNLYYQVKRVRGVI